MRPTLHLILVGYRDEVGLSKELSDVSELLTGMGMPRLMGQTYLQGRGECRQPSTELNCTITKHLGTPKQPLTMG